MLGKKVLVQHKISGFVFHNNIPEDLRPKSRISLIHKTIIDLPHVIHDLLLQHSKPRSKINILIKADIADYTKEVCSLLSHFSSRRSAKRLPPLTPEVKRKAPADLPGICPHPINKPGCPVSPTVKGKEVSGHAGQERYRSKHKKLANVKLGIGDHRGKGEVDLPALLVVVFDIVERGI